MLLGTGARPFRHAGRGTCAHRLARHAAIRPVVRAARTGRRTPGRRSRLCPGGAAQPWPVLGSASRRKDTQGTAWTGAAASHGRGRGRGSPNVRKWPRGSRACARTREDPGRCSRGRVRWAGLLSARPGGREAGRAEGPGCRGERTRLGACPAAVPYRPALDRPGVPWHRSAATERRPRCPGQTQCCAVRPTGCQDGRSRDSYRSAISPASCERMACSTRCRSGEGRTPSSSESLRHMRR